MFIDVTMDFEDVKLMAQELSDIVKILSDNK